MRTTCLPVPYRQHPIARCFKSIESRKVVDRVGPDRRSAPPKLLAVQGLFSNLSRQKEGHAYSLDSLIVVFVCFAGFVPRSIRSNRCRHFGEFRASGTSRLRAADLSRCRLPMDTRLLGL